MQNPETYGRFTGQFVIGIILIVGISKCFSISRRETTNTKCVLGLTWVLSSWLVASIGGAITPWFPPPYNAAFGLVLGIVLMGLIVMAVVFSILGLIEYNGNKALFTQGKSQAIWALVLTGLFIIPFSFGLYKATIARNAVPKGMQAAQPTGGEVKFDSLNFRYQIPDQRWVVVDKNKVNPQASMIIMRANPSAMLLVVAENVGVESEITEEGLLESVQATMRSTSPSATFKIRPTSLKGMKGQEMEMEWNMGNIRYFGISRIFYHNGYAYQLSFRGMENVRSYIRREADKIFAGFSVIDPNRVAHVEGLRPPEKYESPFGYKVALKGEGWTKWSTLATDLPQAEFGVLYKNTGALSVVPIFLLDLNPDWDALVEAGLARLGISSTDEKLTHVGKWDKSSMEMAIYSFERASNEGVYEYRILIAKHERFAYVVAVWELKGTAPSTFLDSAIKQVTFLPASKLKMPKPGTFSSSDSKRHGLFLNDVGVFYFKSHLYEKSLPYFETACQFENQNKVFLRNLADACIQTKEFSKGVDYLKKATHFSADDEFKVTRAYFLSQMDEEKEALETYESVFSKGYRNDAYFEEYINLLFQRGEFETALTKVEKYLESKDSVRIRTWQATLLRQTKDFDKAIAVMQAQQAKYPSNTEIIVSLWQSYHAAERDADALELCDQLLAKGYDSAYAYTLKGRSQLALKHYREAKESFEVALKKKPSDPDIKSYLDYVSGILGEGDNSAVKNPITAVAIPESLLKDTVVLPAGLQKEYGAHYEKIIAAISFEKGKEQKVTEFARVRLNDASGVNRFSSLQFSFDPLGEEVFVNELLVKNADGKVVSTGKVADYYVVDEGGELATHNKILNVPISGLQPGFTLEWTFTRRDFGKPEEFRFFSQTFSKHYPIGRSIVYLRGNVDQVKSISSTNIPAQKIDGGLFWEVNQPVVYRYEPLQQSFENYLPMIWLGDTNVRWKSIGTNYLQSITDRLAIDSTTRALAEKHVAKATATDEKVMRLAQFVQTNLTYKGIEFGRRARIPNSAGKTIENRYGDCKDHSVLLHALLKGAGIDSHLALIHSYGKIEKELPSLDQFNHMILYVPSLRGGMFLDCTAKSSDVAESALSNLCGQDALILDPQNPHFIRVPGYPGESAKVVVNRVLTIENETNIISRESVTFHGIQAAYQRATLKAVEPANWKSIVQQQITSDRQPAEIEDLKIEHLDDLQKPLTMQITARMKNSFQKTENSILGTAPAWWEVVYLAPLPSNKRQTPFEIRFPLTLESTISIALPGGYKLPSLGVLNQNSESAYADIASLAKPTASGLEWRYNFRRKVGQFPVGEYAAYEGTMNKAVQLLQSNLIFERDKK